MLRYVRCTLVQVMKGEEILLGMKKRGLGVGKWNGFGGKLAPNETLKQCAVRELFEESSLCVEESDLSQIGILVFDFLGENFVLEVNVFQTSRFTGIPVESEEMAPKWFLKKCIPFEKMWADDYLWYPKMFNNELFYGFLAFQGHDNMVSHEFKQVKSVEEMEELRDITKKQYTENFQNESNVVISKQQSGLKQMST